MAKLLIPFDGSESAMRAVRHAINMAKDPAQYEVHLLHVQDITHLGTDDSFWQGGTKEKLLDEGERTLVPAKQACEQAGVPCQTHVTIGIPANDIPTYARSLGCDAIIMGTRGMSAVASFFVGSVAQRVIHNSEIPVTLVR